MEMWRNLLHENHKTVDQDPGNSRRNTPIGPSLEFSADKTLPKYRTLPQP